LWFSLTLYFITNVVCSCSFLLINGFCSLANAHEQALAAAATAAAAATVHPRFLERQPSAISHQASSSLVYGYLLV
jgi:hypothetical protein